MKGTTMRCDICGKPGAENFYGVGVYEHGTKVSTARWGKNITAARKRAREAVLIFREPGEFQYDVFTVCAHNRAEVARAYEC